MRLFRKKKKNKKAWDINQFLVKKEYSKNDFIIDIEIKNADSKKNQVVLFDLPKLEWAEFDEEKYLEEIYPKIDELKRIECNIKIKVKLEKCTKFMRVDDFINIIEDSGFSLVQYFPGHKYGLFRKRINKVKFFKDIPNVGKVRILPNDFDE